MRQSGKGPSEAAPACCRPYFSFSDRCLPRSGIGLDSKDGLRLGAESLQFAELSGRHIILALRPGTAQVK